MSINSGDEEDANDSSSQDDESQNYFDLYNYLSDPNPLLKKSENEQYSVNTALRILFK